MAGLGACLYTATTVPILACSFTSWLRAPRRDGRRLAFPDAPGRGVLAGARRPGLGRHGWACKRLSFLHMLGIVYLLYAPGRTVVVLALRSIRRRRNGLAAQGRI